MKQHDTTSLSIADQTNKKNIICIDVLNLVGRDGWGHQGNVEQREDWMRGMEYVIVGGGSNWFVSR